MIPQSVMALMKHHEDDPPDTFRLSDAKNHPFLSNIKFEFARKSDSDAKRKGEAATFLHWVEKPPVKIGFKRVQDIYDASGWF